MSENRLTNEDSDANHVDFVLIFLKISCPQFEHGFATLTLTQPAPAECLHRQEVSSHQRGRSLGLLALPAQRLQLPELTPPPLAPLLTPRSTLLPLLFRACGPAAVSFLG
jgi:hypothetical protein